MAIVRILTTKETDRPVAETLRRRTIRRQAQTQDHTGTGHDNVHQRIMPCGTRAHAHTHTIGLLHNKNPYIQENN